MFAVFKYIHTTDPTTEFSSSFLYKISSLQICLCTICFRFILEFRTSRVSWTPFVVFSDSIMQFNPSTHTVQPRRRNERAIHLCPQSANHYVCVWIQNMHDKCMSDFAFCFKNNILFLCQCIHYDMRSTVFNYIHKRWKDVLRNKVQRKDDKFKT